MSIHQPILFIPPRVAGTRGFVGDPRPMAKIEVPKNGAIVFALKQRRWRSSSCDLSGPSAWLLSDIQRLPEPIPCRGSLGLWEVPAEILSQIEQQMERMEDDYRASLEARGLVPRRNVVPQGAISSDLEHDEIGALESGDVSEGV